MDVFDETKFIFILQSNMDNSRILWAQRGDYSHCTYMAYIYHMLFEKQSFRLTNSKKLISSHGQQHKFVFNGNNIFAYFEAQGYDT